MQTIEGFLNGDCSCLKSGFPMLEAKLKHDWAKKGAIKIIDVPRDYYQVLFTLDEDYNHALMEGLWIVGITILWYSVGDHFF